MNVAAISYPAEAHWATRKIEDNSFWYCHRNNIIVEAVKKNIVGKPMLYDLGGGNGVVTKALINAGYNCTLVEALPDAVRIAEERGIEKTIQSSIQDFKQAELPVILLFDVIEHIENDTDLLQQMFQQIKKGGTIIITVPAFNHLTTDIDKEIGHFRRYTINELAGKLKREGFIIHSKTYFFSLLYLPFLFFRVIPYKLGLTKNNESRRDKEHLSKRSWLNKLAIKILQWECRFVRSNHVIPFGTSCLLVAQKP